MPSQKKSLTRFHKAQDNRTRNRTQYEVAFDEIENGAKTSHWIWYIFPQLEILGYSATAKRYGIKHFTEACDYLRDPILFKKYMDIVKEALSQLESGVTVVKLMGDKTDARKLTSSTTLFREAATYLSKSNEESSKACFQLIGICNRILKITSKQGFPECNKTLEEETVKNRRIQAYDTEHDDSDDEEDASNRFTPPRRSGYVRKAIKPNKTVSIIQNRFEDIQERLEAIIVGIPDNNLQCKSQMVLDQLIELHSQGNSVQKKRLTGFASATEALLGSTTLVERKMAIENYKKLAYQAQGTPSPAWKALGGSMMILFTGIAMSGCALIAVGVFPIGAPLIAGGILAALGGTYFFRPKGLAKEMHDLSYLNSEYTSFGKK